MSGAEQLDAEDRRYAQLRTPPLGAERRHRASSLTTHEMIRLDDACSLIRQAFGPPYLVGSAERGEPYRDVDVRLILEDETFDALMGAPRQAFADASPNRKRWELLSLALGDYLRVRTGLPVDFQIQRMTEANSRHKGVRNPLGMGRSFAGGGDATPWAGTP